MILSNERAVSINTVMKTGRAYIILLVAGLALVGFYMSFSDIKPINTKGKIIARYQATATKPVQDLMNSTKNVLMEKLDEEVKSADQMEPLALEDRTQIINQRVKALNQKCQNLSREGVDFSTISRSKLNHVVVNDEYEVLYCYIPKVACTNMKRVFLILTGMMNQSDPLELKSGDVHKEYDKYLTYLDSMTPSEIKYRLANYRKVIFVRDPLERMLSAFRNKFLQRSNLYFKEKFGRKIVKKFRKNASNRSLEMGDDVKFREFVSYLLDPKTIQAGYNEHWATYTELCHPCHLHYNFIGKYETLDDDVGYLLNEMGIGDKIQFPKRGDLYRTVKTEDTLQQYYQQLKSSQTKELMMRYGDDYEMFDYKFPETIVNLLGNSTII